ncbi:heat-inducible transcriptional repressor HrcA [Oceanicella actignis]|uniref:Heat-inducible transcription repressor HrcA n=1 Tax=Oceanicella actignis TaxID=1189325 RepID=A0A1M7SXD4_9RHOB|nr:heat-inducible transcriptional repressor HrcA [Oceanicella actignis]TYO90561.1 heat-inducible transcription repressor HrcA [Oceanicella actignis]SES74649.1 heat-inducible transcription repressor HrcA [Oceanicella actignis]SHN63034.1 heat-inducible transcription repressor HrcA [Oceanicella actignis]
MTGQPARLSDLNDRSREIFRRLVETYLETGDPVGSRTLSRSMDNALSPATVRNVMQDLEHLGLLGSPHVSAGRVPTEMGLRLFVDGLLEIGDISPEERQRIESGLTADERAAGDLTGMLARAGALLSGLTRGASLVFAPKTEEPIKHIEFVSLSPEAALVVIVTESGAVENRLFAPPPGLTPSAMREAANFLNAALRGRTLSEASAVIHEEIAARRRELDALAAQLVERGAEIWQGDGGAHPERVIVRGAANLLDDVASEEELERMRRLLDDMERKEDLLQLLNLAEEGEGVRIFIGSENKLFSLSGSSLVISPYMDAERRIIGAIGVIGPTRLNYGRVVPIVDYTARLMGRLMSDRRRGMKG